MTLTLDYLSFTVRDMAVALAFYRSLGLPIPEGAHLNAAAEPEDHVEVVVSGLRVAWETEALIRRLNPNWTAPVGQRVGIAFKADSPDGVDETCRRLTAAGFAVRDQPYDAFWGQRYATLLDPDGNSVDVFAWSSGTG